MDLDNLAPWYEPMTSDGCDPCLEIPSGEIVPGEKIVTKFALEMGQGRGIELFPKDPFDAAEMEL